MSALDDLLSELEAPVVPKTAKTTPAKAATSSKPADDLDSLLADLSPITTKKTSSAAPSAPKSTAPVDDLDALLSDLGGGSSKPAAAKVSTPAAASKKVSAAKPAASAADDLDGLLNDLGGASAPKKVAPTKPIAAAATDDLDSLLSDLSGPSKTAAPAGKKVSATTPASPKPAAAKPVDDLDSLLGELGGGAAAPSPKKVTAAKPATAKPVAAKPVDDLDSLLGELGGAPVPKTVSAKTTAPPAKPVASAKPSGAVKPADDLDALMADLGGPSAAPAPKKVAVAKPVDDLDSLMADLGSPKPVSSPAAAKKVASPATPKKSSGDDLDSLMADLGGPAKPTPAAFKAPSIAPAASNKRADELDSLMNSLSSGSLNTQPKNASNDLDDLMSSLATPASATSAVRPAAPSMASRPPAGSVSRFDDLMTTVSADMSDISTGAGKSRGICYHCRQPIYDECMQALGRTYHPEHFMCGSCNNPLGTGSFFELAGQAHCQRCYQIQFCPKCAHCNQAITDRCVTALDKKWHVHCFVCTQCTSPFTGNFFERDGRPYCDKCFHQVFAPRCRSCNLPVLGDCVNALGAQWHPEHFNCQFCRRAFTGTFFEYEGMPYCEAHYYQKMGSSCSGCQQPISGACVDALGKKWHPEHFVCAFCMNKLEGSSYSEKNSKPYCRGCFGKLFGS